jgi:hypothetical protein
MDFRKGQTMKPTATNIFMATIVGLLIFAIGSSRDRPSYRYKIYDSNRNAYRADSYKNDGACIVFTSKNRGDTRMCGSFTIIDLEADNNESKQ